MKKLKYLISSVIFLLLSNLANAQLINQGFETWSNDMAVPTAMNPNNGNNTTGWCEYNYFNYAPMGSSPISVKRCTDTVHSGNYSARIQTQVYSSTSWNIYKNWGIPFIGHIYSDTLGILFNGNVNELAITYVPGIPFTQKITQFSFYYQYKPSGNDTAECRVMLVNHRSPVAGGRFKTNISTASSGWQQATINLTYVSSQTPDTLWVLFSASSLDRNPKPGSVLWVDDASVTLPTGIFQMFEKNDNIQMYPNPTNGIISLVQQSQAIRKQQIIEIYNLIGEKIYSAVNNQQSEFTIDISNQPKGIYFLNLTDGETSNTKKIILQ